MAFVSAIMLAAGESARMGRQKAMLPWEGTSLIEYQLTQLSSVDEIRQIVVVTGHKPEAIRRVVGRFARACAVHNPGYASGKVSSILAGLKSLSPESEAIMLVAVDQPRPASVVQLLVRSHLDSRPPITAPVHGGRRGHPIVFGRELLPELLAVSEESLGIRAVLRRNAAATLEVEIDAPVIFVDLNLPSDLELDGRDASLESGARP